MLTLLAVIAIMSTRKYSIPLMNYFLFFGTYIACVMGMRFKFITKTDSKMQAMRLIAILQRKYNQACIYIERDSVYYVLRLVNI